MVASVMIVNGSGMFLSAELTATTEIRTSTTSEEKKTYFILH